MAFVQLTIGSLEELHDGRLAAAFLLHLKRLIQDCHDRPGEKKARKMAMQITVTPVVEVGDSIVECIGADAEFTFKSAIPDHRSKAINLRTNKNGQASFSAESEDNADQLTFNDVDPKTGKPKR